VEGPALNNDKGIERISPMITSLNGKATGKTAHPEAAREPTIQVEDLTKDYVMGDNVVHALRGITLTVEAGEFVAVMGASGSGKSTFMNLVGCLDRPTSGSYLLDGIDVSRLGPDDLAQVRNRKVGFIFQGFNLLARMTALGNVILPMVYAGVPADVREERGRIALQAVGLTGREDHRPNQLSGGQQQRVAIARSLVNGPSIILADEPTGNLDSRTSVEVMAILQRLNADGITIVLVTHESDIAAYTHRVVRFRDGRVIEDQRNPHPVDAAETLAQLPDPNEGEAA
jgi:putative ABC transport system ATP-binding protein